MTAAPVIAAPSVNRGYDPRAVSVAREVRERVVVVETEVAKPVEVPRDAEVQIYRGGVSEMQIAVRLRRPAGMNPADETPGIVILRNPRADEVFGCQICHNAASPDAELVWL